MGRLRKWAGVVGWFVLAWSTGFLWFATSIPLEPPQPGSAEAEQHTDAIVVLTGGSERLGVGLDLLAAGKARKLFVSGVYHSVDVRELLRVSRQKLTMAPIITANGKIVWVICGSLNSAISARIPRPMVSR